MDVGKGREHDCMDAGGRATPGAVAEERKLRLKRLLLVLLFAGGGHAHRRALPAWTQVRGVSRDAYKDVGGRVMPGADYRAEALPTWT